MPKTLQTRPRSQRTRDDDSTDEPYSDELEGSSPSVMIDGEDVSSFDDADENDDDIGSDDSAPSDFDRDEEYSEVSSEDAEEDVQAQLNKVSFGDLAKAQSKMSTSTSNDKKRKRGAESSADTEAKLQALRERLRELREAKGITTTSSTSRTTKDQLDIEATSGSATDDDSDAPESTSTKRSKHAPMAAPSNRTVSRKRNVISSDKPASARARDPRFAPLSGPTTSREQVAKNYAFLNEYRESEIADLKDKLGENQKGRNKASAPPKKKASKLNEEDRARLKKELTRMESREQSRKERQRLEDVAKKHKQDERAKIAQGKNPFFLKNSEQKRLALVGKFEGMKSKQRDKALDRRRKKLAAKEKKSMPGARRSYTD